MHYLFSRNHIAGIIGISGTGLILYVLVSPVIGMSLPLNPAAMVLSGLFLLLGWIYLSKGYKRSVFHLLSFTGTFLVLLSLKILPRISSLFIFKNSAADLAAGLMLLVSCRYVSLKAYFNSRKFAVRILALSVIFLWGTVVFASRFPVSGENLVERGEVEEVLKRLSPYYTKLGDDVENRVRKILSDDSLSKSEKDRMIEELNKKIKQLEEETAVIAEIKKENGRYRDEIEKLKAKVGQAVLCPGLDKNELVTTFREAVHTADNSISPCVRDFAVKLASSHPGSYYRYGGANPSPGRDGIYQIIAVHRYVSTQWKYVNDPLSTVHDYYSPADRTIAAGLAGDCDDFAVLLAASIEAIGGRVRILGGTCSGEPTRGVKYI